MKCRICNAESDTHFSANGYQWLDCRSCDSIQKVLTPEQYVELNPSYDPGIYLDAVDRRQIEAYLRIDDAMAFIDRARRKFVASITGDGARPQFLDVGCGMGSYLLAAQKLGFEVMGFEPSESHARVAKSRLSLPIVSGYFSADAVQGRTFDLIMLSHVIEHIYSPKEMLRQLVGVLKPGGALIVVTPNCRSVIARTTGSRWPMLKPLDHVSMISAKTYDHLELSRMASVQHWYSEYPYEFAATIAATMKEALKSRLSAHAGIARTETISSAPPLRRAGLSTRMLKCMLTACSLPAWAFSVATRRQACLNSAIVRNMAASP